MSHSSSSQHSIAWHQELLDHLPFPIAVHAVVNRTDFRLVFANTTLWVGTGMPLETLLNKPLIELLPPEEAACLTRHLQTCVDHGELFEAEASYATPSVTRWVETTYIPIRDPQGQITQILSIGRDITARKERERAEQTHQITIIEQQARTLTEVSTPLLAISDTTILMPLVGTIDTSRVQQIMESLLSGVAASRATAVILDITGVSVVDTQVANALLQAAQAVKLLGAEIVLTGIRPEVAQTLVQLGVNLHGMTIRATLRDGIAYTLLR